MVLILLDDDILAYIFMHFHVNVLGLSKKYNFIVVSFSNLKYSSVFFDHINVSFYSFNIVSVFSFKLSFIFMF